MLKGFATNGRDLTDKETKAFLKAADKDGDGKIGVEGEICNMAGDSYNSWVLGCFTIKASDSLFS